MQTYPDKLLDELLAKQFKLSSKLLRKQEVYIAFDEKRKPISANDVKTQRDVVPIFLDRGSIETFFYAWNQHSIKYKIEAMFYDEAINVVKRERKDALLVKGYDQEILALS